MADFPQARNLRWYHLISQAYDDHTVTVAVTFDA